MGEKRDCGVEIEKAGKTGATIGGEITGAIGAATGLVAVGTAAAESAVPVAITGLLALSAGALIGHEVGGDTKSALKGAVAGTLAFPGAFAVVGSLPGIVVGAGIEKAAAGLSCVAGNWFAADSGTLPSPKQHQPAQAAAKGHVSK